MRKLLKEVLEELLLVLTGKSLDILLPPVLFLILYKIGDLTFALLGSLVLSAFFLLLRVRRKENLYYAIGGFGGILFAAIISYLNNSATSFFLPDIIGTFIITLVTIISLIKKKPIAALVSHITRGWSLDWFYRDDVLPAYKEVSIFWLVFFIVRLTIEISLFSIGSVENLVIANIILGLPVTLTVLTISYLYGIWRLHNLKGPGVDEFRENIDPPWKGQRRGF